MNNVKVCDAVNWQIQLSGINAQDARALKTCISRYTPYTDKGGIEEKIKYFIQRVCNAIKSALGQSDWQKAEQVITKNIYSYVPLIYRDLVKNKTEAHVHYLAGRMLNFMIWQNKNQLYVPAPVKSMIQTQLILVPFAVKMMFKNLFQQTFYRNPHFAASSGNSHRRNGEESSTGSNRSTSDTSLTLRRWSRSSARVETEQNLLLPLIVNIGADILFSSASPSRLLLTN